jgi:hypothetical protein
LKAAPIELEFLPVVVLEGDKRGRAKHPIRKRLMLTTHSMRKPPFTLAVRQALQNVNNSQIEADFLFLEAWEMQPSSHLGVTLKASQIRRANPGLAAAIDAELKAAPERNRG